MRTLGSDPGDKEEFLHNLKMRLTAISGYAQLLERQINESEHATERQRDYMARLRRLINDLSQTIHEHNTDERAQKDEQSRQDDGNGPSSPCNSECLSN